MKPYYLGCKLDTDWEEAESGFDCCCWDAEDDEGDIELLLLLFVSEVFAVVEVVSCYLYVVLYYWSCYYTREFDYCYSCFVFSSYFWGLDVALDCIVDY